MMHSEGCNQSGSDTEETGRESQPNRDGDPAATPRGLSHKKLCKALSSAAGLSSAPGSALRFLDQEFARGIAEGDARHCRQCIDSGANVNSMTDRATPLLFYALMRAKDAEIVTMLLGAGASVHQTDGTGHSILHIWARSSAATEAMLEIGEALIRADADIDAQRPDGSTALHLLAGARRHRGDWAGFHKARLLLRHGASSGLANSSGMLPIEMLKNEMRGTTMRFQELLGTAHGGRATFPVCPREQCSWCCNERTLYF